MRRLSVLVLVLAIGVAARPIEPPSFSFPRSAPEAQGISSAAILAFVEEAEQKLDALHSIMIVRHGQVVAEGWWAPYAASEPHMLYSLSKSFTSTAVGLAVAEGKLKVDDPVLGFFPDEAPAQPSANLKAMRVRDLLTMSTGHHDEDIRDFPYNGEGSVVKAFLDRPVAHKPGTFFFYNTPASYMLSAIVQKVTGQSVLAYLGPRLFEPLGIENPTWDASKQGVSLGGFGLNVRTEDIARFGQLYLQKGMWQGKQLIPAAWVSAATSRLMSNGSSPASDWEQGYGYQFWQSRHGFRGDGAHGQFCLVLPQSRHCYRDHQRHARHGVGHESRLGPSHPRPSACGVPADAVASRKLADKLAALKLRAPSGTAASTTARSWLGKRYAFDSNKLALEAISLDAASASGEPSFVVRIAGVDQRIEIGRGSWRKGTLRLAADGAADAIAASGAWTADDTYTLSVVRYRTPFATTYQLRFAGDQLFLKAEQNVGAADARITEIVGRMAGTSSR